MLGNLPELAFYGVDFKAMVKVSASEMACEGRPVSHLPCLIRKRLSLALVCLQRTNAKIKLFSRIILLMIAQCH